MTIYIVAESVLRGPCKIGITEGNLSARFIAIQNGNPRRLRMVWAFETAGGTSELSAERRIHARLSDYRLVGEWFAVSVKTARLAVAAHLAAISATYDVQRPIIRAKRRDAYCIDYEPNIEAMRRLVNLI